MNYLHLFNIFYTIAAIVMALFFYFVRNERKYHMILLLLFIFTPGLLTFYPNSIEQAKILLQSHHVVIPVAAQYFLLYEHLIVLILNIVIFIFSLAAWLSYIMKKYKLTKFCIYINIILYLLFLVFITTSIYLPLLSIGQY